MNDQAVLAWLAARADAGTLFAIAAAALFWTEVAKRIVRWARGPETFSEWWLVAGVIGSGLGLALVSPSLPGAVVGLVAALVASGGYDSLKGAGRLLGADRTDP